jgi:hypothetical protein
VEFTKAVQAFEAKGLNVKPITINIDDLKEWCRKNKVKNTGSSRSKYVAEISNY